VHAAVQQAATLGPGKTIVVTLPDSASRYVTKYLDDRWMKDHGMLDTGPDLGSVEDLIGASPRQVVTARPGDTVGKVVELLRSQGVSQVPLQEPGQRPTSIVHEIDLLRGLHRGDVHLDTPVSRVAQPIGGLVYPKARIEELFPILENDRVAVVVDANRLLGVVSNIDLIEFMAAKERRR
ncbi:MAG: CBS domain-containing protein, partial [Phycisphaerales bacterium]|nr:CBS domain-containing protein [Phycisphaerales bacterium]